MKVTNVILHGRDQFLMDIPIASLTKRFVCRLDKHKKGYIKSLLMTIKLDNIYMSKDKMQIDKTIDSLLENITSINGVDFVYENLYGRQKRFCGDIICNEATQTEIIIHENNDIEFHIGVTKEK